MIQKCSRYDNGGWKVESCAVPQLFLSKAEIGCMPEDSSYGPLDFTAKFTPKLSKLPNLKNIWHQFCVII